MEVHCDLSHETQMSLFNKSVCEVCGAVAGGRGSSELFPLSFLLAAAFEASRMEQRKILQAVPCVNEIQAASSPLLELKQLLK